MTRLGLELTTSRTQGGHSTHKATEDREMQIKPLERSFKVHLGRSGL